MPVYSLTPIYQPQFVDPAGAVLTFATLTNPTEVPANFNYQIDVAHVANVTAAPVSFKCWRVPAGQANDDAHIIVPSINIPVATQTFPYFDLTALWGVVLQPGDSIWALAGSASALVLQADGALIQL